MFKLYLFIPILCAVCSMIFLSDINERIIFADIETAKKLLTTEDQFTANWSQFDIDSRLKKKNSTKSELLDHISSQAMEWNEQERSRLMDIIVALSLKIDSQKFKLNLPPEIVFIKTTGDEEGGASGYTRSNYIVLNEKTLKGTDASLEKLIAHELFHVLSRHDHEFKNEMYESIGFKVCNEVVYPDTILRMRITNPDAPVNDSYIKLERNGEPFDGMMILYSDREYDGGDFFNYLNIGFLKVEGGESKSVVLENGKPLIYKSDEVSKFYDQIGDNTKYVIHPEEVLAENFVFAVQNRKSMPSQWLIEKLQKKLKE